MDGGVLTGRIKPNASHFNPRSSITFDLQPSELISDTCSYLRRRQCQPALVSRYFQEPTRPS